MAGGRGLRLMYRMLGYENDRDEFDERVEGIVFPVPRCPLDDWLLG